MKIKGAKDMSAPLRKTAQSCMPEFAKGGKVKKMAAGGGLAVNLRKAPTGGNPNNASKKPGSPKVKFKGKVGVGGS